MWFKYDPTYTKTYPQQEAIVKEQFKKKLKEKLIVKEPPGLPKKQPIETITNTTDDNANTYIKENPEITINCLRNERVMKDGSK